MHRCAIPAEEGHLHVSAGQHLLDDAQFAGVRLDLLQLVSARDLLQSPILTRV